MKPVKTDSPDDHFLFMNKKAERCMKSPDISQSISVETMLNIDSTVAGPFETEKNDAVVNLSRKIEKVIESETDSGIDSSVRLQSSEIENEENVNATTESELSKCEKVHETIDSSERGTLELSISSEKPQSTQKQHDANEKISGKTQLTLTKTNDSLIDISFEERSEQKESEYLEEAPNTFQVSSSNEAQIATTPVEESQYAYESDLSTAGSEFSIHPYQEKPFNQNKSNVLTQKQTELDLLTDRERKVSADSLPIEMPFGNQYLPYKNSSTHGILAEGKRLDSWSVASSRNEPNQEENKSPELMKSKLRISKFIETDSPATDHVEKISENDEEKVATEPHEKDELKMNPEKHYLCQAAAEELHGNKEHKTHILPSQEKSALTCEKTPSRLGSAVAPSIDKENKEFLVKSDILTGGLKLILGSDEDSLPDSFVKPDSSKSVKALETDLQDKAPEQQKLVQMEEGIHLEGTAKSLLTSSTKMKPAGVSEKIQSNQKDDKATVELQTKSELSPIAKTKALTLDISTRKSPILKDIDEQLLSANEQSTKIGEHSYELPSDYDFSSGTESNSVETTNEQAVGPKFETEVKVDSSIVSSEKNFQAIETKKMRDELSELPMNTENDSLINLTNQITCVPVKSSPSEQLTKISKTQTSIEHHELPAQSHDEKKVSVLPTTKSEFSTKSQVPEDSFPLESYTDTEIDTARTSGMSQEMEKHQPIHLLDEKIYTDEGDENAENIDEKKFSASSDVLSLLDSSQELSIRFKQKTAEEKDLITSLKGKNLNNSYIKPRIIDDAALVDLSSKPEFSVERESPHLGVESRLDMRKTQLELGATIGTDTSPESNTQTNGEIEGASLDLKISNISTTQSSFVSSETCAPIVSLDEKLSEISIGAKKLDELTKPNLSKCTAQFPIENVHKKQFHQENLIVSGEMSKKSEIDTTRERETTIYHHVKQLLVDEEDPAESRVTQNFLSDTQTEISLSVKESSPDEDNLIHTESPTSEKFLKNIKSNVQTDPSVFGAPEKQPHSQEKQAPVEYSSTKSEFHANGETHMIDEAFEGENNVESLTETSEITGCTINTSTAKSSMEEKYSGVETPIQEQIKTICDSPINAEICSKKQSPIDSSVRDENITENVKLIETPPILSQFAIETTEESIFDLTGKELAIPKVKKEIEVSLIYSEHRSAKQSFSSSVENLSLPEAKLSIKVQPPTQEERMSLESELLTTEKTFSPLESEEDFSILKDNQMLAKSVERSTSSPLKQAPTDTFMEKTGHLESKTDGGESRDSDIDIDIKRESDEQVILSSDEHETDAEGNVEPPETPVVSMQKNTNLATYPSEHPLERAGEESAADEKQKSPAESVIKVSSGEIISPVDICETNLKEVMDDSLKNSPDAVEHETKFEKSITEQKAALTTDKPFVLPGKTLSEFKENTECVEPEKTPLMDRDTNESAHASTEQTASIEYEEPTEKSGTKLGIVIDTDTEAHVDSFLKTKELQESIELIKRSPTSELDIDSKTIKLENLCQEKPDSHEENESHKQTLTESDLSMIRKSVRSPDEESSAQKDVTATLKEDSSNTLKAGARIGSSDSESNFSLQGLEKQRSMHEDKTFRESLQKSELPGGTQSPNKTIEERIDLTKSDKKREESRNESDLGKEEKDQASSTEEQVLSISDFVLRSADELSSAPDETLFPEQVQTVSQLAETKKIDSANNLSCEKLSSQREIEVNTETHNQSEFNQIHEVIRQIDPMKVSEEKHKSLTLSQIKLESSPICESIDQLANEPLIPETASFAARSHRNRHTATTDGIEQHSVVSYKGEHSNQELHIPEQPETDMKTNLLIQPNDQYSSTSERNASLDRFEVESCPEEKGIVNVEHPHSEKDNKSNTPSKFSEDTPELVESDETHLTMEQANKVSPKKSRMKDEITFGATKDSSRVRIPISKENKGELGLLPQYELTDKDTQPPVVPSMEKPFLREEHVTLLESASKSAIAQYESQQSEQTLQLLESEPVVELQNELKSSLIETEAPIEHSDKNFPKEHNGFEIITDSTTNINTTAPSKISSASASIFENSKEVELNAEKAQNVNIDNHITSHIKCDEVLEKNQAVENELIASRLPSTVEQEKREYVVYPFGKIEAVELNIKLLHHSSLEKSMESLEVYVTPQGINQQQIHFPDDAEYDKHSDSKTNTGVEPSTYPLECEKITETEELVSFGVQDKAQTENTMSTTENSTISNERFLDREKHLIEDQNTEDEVQDEDESDKRDNQQKDITDQRKKRRNAPKPTQIRTPKKITMYSQKRDDVEFLENYNVRSQNENSSQTRKMSPRKMNASLLKTVPHNEKAVKQSQPACRVQKGIQKLSPNISSKSTEAQPHSKTPAVRYGVKYPNKQNTPEKALKEYIGKTNKHSELQEAIKTEKSPKSVTEKKVYQEKIRQSTRTENRKDAMKTRLIQSGPSTKTVRDDSILKKINDSKSTRSDVCRSKTQTTATNVIKKRDIYSEKPGKQKLRESQDFRSSFTNINEKNREVIGSPNKQNCITDKQLPINRKAILDKQNISFSNNAKRQSRVTGNRSSSGDKNKTDETFKTRLAVSSKNKRDVSRDKSKVGSKNKSDITFHQGKSVSRTQVPNINKEPSGVRIAQKDSEHSTEKSPRSKYSNFSGPSRNTRSRDVTTVKTENVTQLSPKQICQVIASDTISSNKLIQKTSTCNDSYQKKSGISKTPSDSPGKRSEAKSITFKDHPSNKAKVGHYETINQFQSHIDMKNIKHSDILMKDDSLEIVLTSTSEEVPIMDINRITNDIEKSRIKQKYDRSRSSKFSSPSPTQKSFGETTDSKVNKPKQHRYMTSTLSRDIKLEKTPTISSKSNKSKSVSKTFGKSSHVIKDASPLSKASRNNVNGNISRKSLKYDFNDVYRNRSSPSPTRLRKPVMIESRKSDKADKDKHAIKSIEFEKCVQFSEDDRSHSAIPTTYQELRYERIGSPISLPGSPQRTRSANGNNKLITSEVFSRTRDNSLSIEVVYRQPYENMKRVASTLRNETEHSLIDTTDSSLSESIALPSSPSDQDVSIDTNGKHKIVSPKPRKSLGSINESLHRISDLAECVEIFELSKLTSDPDENGIAFTRKLVMAQYPEKEDLQENAVSKVVMSSQFSEETISPIMDVHVISPIRRKYQFDYEDVATCEKPSSGKTQVVFPETNAMSSTSMASEIESSTEDNQILETTDMSLNLNIPQIAITPEAEEDDDNNFLNLNEALTDIEELFDDAVSARRRSFQKKLKIKVVDTDGYNTAMEDIEASDDEEIIIIRKHSSPIVVESFDMEKYSTEENIEIAEKKSFGYQHLNMKSSESNNSVDFKNANGSYNLAAVTDAEDYDTENEIDENKDTSEDEFNLNDYETMQAIRISDDMQQRQQAPSSSSITFNVPEGRTRRKPPTFSQIMKAKAVKSNDKKARRRKKYRVTASKSNHPEKSEESDSSEIGTNERKNKDTIISMNSLNYESELEDDAQLPFPVCKKMFVKTKKCLQMPDCNVQDVTDTEDIECDIDLSRRRISVDNTIVQKQLDEMASCYSFTKDKNEAKDLEYESKPNEQKIKINEEKKCKSKRQHLCSAQNNLEVVSNQDNGGTDIENIGSSSEDEEPETQKDQHYYSDTEEEIFDVDFTVNTENSPEVNLPPTTRTLIIAEESKSLVPTVRIFPLDDIILDESEVEIHSTDEESFNSVEEKEDNNEFNDPLSSQLPNFEDGLVSVSENFIRPRHAINNIEETGTDIEDLYEENHSNKNGEIHEYKGQYLNPHNNSSLRTGSKKRNLIDEMSGPSILSALNADNEPFTDLENLESTDDEQNNQNRNKITHFNPRVTKSHTTAIREYIDTDDTTLSTDDEVTYSRAETITPHEMKKEVESTTIIPANNGKDNLPKVDFFEQENVMYLKGGGFIADQREFPDDLEVQVEVMDAWEYFNHPLSSGIASMKTEWCATKTDLIDASTTQLRETSHEAEVNSTCRSSASISYQSICNMHSNDYPQNIKSYAQIDDMLDKMLSEVELINCSSNENCFNSLTLEPSSDALIEIPIKKLKTEKTYTTEVDIFVCEDLEEIPKHSNYRINSFKDSHENRGTQSVISNDESLFSPYKCDVLFGEFNGNSDIGTDFDIVEDYYEPIDFCSEYQVHDKDGIWYEGTYRNLSVVLEEDEENLSQNSYKKNAKSGTAQGTPDYVCLKQRFTLENEMEQENNFEYCSDSTQIHSSISTDDSDNENTFNKAEIKVLIKSKQGEPNLVDIDAVKENISKTMKNEISHEYLEKFNEYSSDKRNKKHSNTLPRRNEENRKQKIKPSFTLPRLFLENTEASSHCNKNDNLRQNHNIIAKPNENFPLSFDHAKVPSENSNIDLFANMPFYPTYESCSSTSSTRKTQYIPSTEVTLSEAYCDWTTEIYSLGQTTSPQYLDKLEKKLLDKTCDVKFPGTEIKIAHDFENILKETNAFLKYESQAEPYDTWTDSMCKNIKSEIESSPNTTPTKKRGKKGIFKTLKSFVTKSTENLSSEPEKMSPKSDRTNRKKKTSTGIPTEFLKTNELMETSSHKETSNGHDELLNHSSKKHSKNETQKINSESATTYQVEAQDSHQIIAETTVKKNVTSEGYKEKTLKKSNVQEFVDDLKDGFSKEQDHFINNSTLAISSSDTGAKIERIDENTKHDSDVTTSRQQTRIDDSVDSNKEKNAQISDTEGSTIQTSKKPGIFSFLTKKSKKSTVENEENVEKIVEKTGDKYNATQLFLQQEQNNYYCGSRQEKTEDHKNALSDLDKHQTKTKTIAKTGFVKVFFRS